MKMAPMQQDLFYSIIVLQGRCEIVLNNGNYVYLKDNDLSFTEHFAQSQYQYPRHIYEGLEFFIDLTTIANENTWLLREFGIDFHQL